MPAGIAGIHGQGWYRRAVNAPTLSRDFLQDVKEVGE
jgi:hypothetical protein